MREGPYVVVGKSNPPKIVASKSEETQNSHNILHPMQWVSDQIWRRKLLHDIRREKDEDVSREAWTPSKYSRFEEGEQFG